MCACMCVGGEDVGVSGGAGFGVGGGFCCD